MISQGKIPWPLFLFGPPGTGKTAAAQCLLSRTRDGVYVTTERMIPAVFDREALIWGLIGQSELVVLDELCARSKEIEIEYQAVKRVADLRDSKPTIYISNLGPEALRQTYDDRIYSRLTCGTIFELAGKDRRLE